MAHERGSWDNPERVSDPQQARIFQSISEYLADKFEARYAELVRTTDFSVSDATPTAVPWTTADVDSHGFWDSGDATKFLVPHGEAGVYHFDTHVTWNTSFDGPRILWIYKNATGELYGLINDQPDLANQSYSTSISLPMEEADYVQTFVQQGAGVARSLDDLGAGSVAARLTATRTGDLGTWAP